MQEFRATFAIYSLCNSILYRTLQYVASEVMGGKASPKSIHSVGENGCCCSKDQD